MSNMNADIVEVEEKNEIYTVNAEVLDKMNSNDKLDRINKT